MLTSSHSFTSSPSHTGLKHLHCSLYLLCSVVHCALLSIFVGDDLIKGIYTVIIFVPLIFTPRA